MREQTIMLEGLPLQLKYEIHEIKNKLNLSILYKNDNNRIILHSFNYSLSMDKSKRTKKINFDIQNVIDAI